MCKQLELLGNSTIVDACSKIDAMGATDITRHLVQAAKKPMAASLVKSSHAVYHSPVQLRQYHIAGNIGGN